MSEQEMRKVLEAELSRLMESDPRIVVINADLAGALGTAPLAKKFPDRYYNVGIQEANMTSFAAGLSTLGFIPVIVTFTAFATRRNADQLAVSVAFSERPVKVIGGDPGVAAQVNGGTHMSFEDIAITRALAGFAVVEPADGVSLRKLVPQIMATPDPTYLRLFRKGRPDIYPETMEFTLGKAVVTRVGNDVTIVASGVEVMEALKAADLLEKEGISAEVIDVHTIKPLDVKTITESARRTGAVVTCDNASIVGGLGDAVSEALGASVLCPIVRVAVRDQVGEVGDLNYLLNRFELSAPWIVKATHEALAASASQTEIAAKSKVC